MAHQRTPSRQLLAQQSQPSNSDETTTTTTTEQTRTPAVLENGTYYVKEALSPPPSSHGPPASALIIPTWRNIPNKDQLAILAASRFVDFFQQAAIQTYMVHQLKSFDTELPDSVISHQAGVLQGAFTAAQIVTSILWGRAADQPAIGRKTVLNIGLVGTGLGCIGVGFSQSYGQAVFWRFLCGAINGTVGSARTMVAECTPKPWHSRAFLLLPAAFNVANVLGPLLAGSLVDPVISFPTWFGEDSTFGGSSGVQWMKVYPYAAANLLSTVLLFTEALIIHFFLRETLRTKRPVAWSELNPVTLASNFYHQLIQAKAQGYRILQHQSQQQSLLSPHPDTSELDTLSSNGEKLSTLPPTLPFHRIWTPNVLFTLLTIAIFDFHMGAFSNLWILFLAQPRNPPNPTSTTLLKFSSGLAFPPPTIGTAMSIIGFIGVALQFLLYPYANAKYGLMKSFRSAIFLFPLAYFLAPYIALLPSSTAPPDPSGGVVVWSGIALVLFLQVAARTFALPAVIILLNNCCPHPSVLATIHGLGQACSAMFRTFGPVLGGYWFGVWTERGVIGMAWWMVASIAALGCVAAFWVRNGSGHEIFLPGEEQEMKEGEGSADGR